MSNAAVIKSIDYKTSEGFTPVAFQSESAGYDCKRSKTNHGHLYKYTVDFRMAGLTDANERLLARLASCEALRIRDVNGTELTIGNQHVRMIVTWQDEIGGSPGSSRGTKVKIEWTTARRARLQSFQ